MRKAPFPIDHTFELPHPGVELASMAYFRAIFELVIESLKPTTICEIGIQTGVVSQQLIAAAKARGGRYIGIDPVIPPKVREALGEGPDVELHQATSLAALPRLEFPQLTVIDSDHNYYTAHSELALLTSAWDRAGRPPFAIMMHDTSWPHARRDGYFDIEAIPPEYRQPCTRRGGFSIRSEALQGRGFRDPEHLIATGWGGPRNGVLSAVEDTLAERGDLAVAHVPAAFGLSVIYPADPKPPEFAEAMARLQLSLSLLGELLASLEYARLLAYDMYRKDEQRRILKRFGRWMASPLKAARRRLEAARAAPRS